MSLRQLVTVILFSIAGLIPVFVTERYTLIVILAYAYVLAIYSISWNILATSGQASLGHAAFLGLGAYSALLISQDFGLLPALSLFVGPLLAALVGLGLGLLCLRLKEWFLAMVTFGVAAIVQTIIVDPKLNWLTNGWSGLNTISVIPSSFGNPVLWGYYVVFTILCLAYVAAFLLFRFKTGLAFRSIRDSEVVARSSGVKSFRYKLLAFVLSSYLAGVAGALQYETIIPYLTPDVFNLQNSFWPLIFTLAGGIGTLEGPVVGTIAIWTLWQTFTSTAGAYSLLVLGSFMAVIIIFLPRGIISLLPSKTPRIVSGERSQTPK